MTDPMNPLIVQSDLTVLLEVASPKAGDARASLARFAELEKAPEHIHTYRISPLSLWNAASAGVSPGEVAMSLNGHAKYPVPQSVLTEIHDQMGRYGRLVVVRDFDTGALALTAVDPAILEEVRRDKAVAAVLGERLDGNRFAVQLGNRGPLKQALLKLGWPAADEAGYVEGVALPLELTCELRGYQGEAVQSWWAGGAAGGGNGVLVLPCGSGKTVIGLAAMVQCGVQTLIVATNISAVRQWIREIRAKTDIDPDLVGEYSGEHKDIRPITVATYQVLTWSDPRAGKSVAGVVDLDDGDAAAASDSAAIDGATTDSAAAEIDGEVDLFTRHPHLGLFDRQEWGLVIYDEVHLLPAPVFRATAHIQAVRRLGLTATLVREDGREGDVFSLIGPKRYDAPWKELEAQGWIAPARCTEIRVAMSDEQRMDYAVTDPQNRYRLAASSKVKLPVLDVLLARHTGDLVLVIGQYIDQLKEVAKRLDAPLITGQTSSKVRDERFGAFRRGEIPVLVVSKVANFSIDLPEANVAVQLSGTFGSRQEEAQRLGRLLRPKHDGGQAHFYSVVTRETVDQSFAANRQRFLTEQGYTYEIIDAEDL
jgi:DNA excision repair protein ERCC-3